jgi:hypothetical protein
MDTEVAAGKSATESQCHSTKGSMIQWIVAPSHEHCPRSWWGLKLDGVQCGLGLFHVPSQEFMNLT